MVVGAGISGVACARELDAAGLPVLVWDRGRRVGGRLGCRVVSNRPVDIGASYFTVSHPAFAEVVRSWTERGLARPWTDTFAVGGPDGLRSTSTGPLRYAALRGLRTLVEDLAVGLYVERSVEVETVEPGPRVNGVPARAVVLAMPDPQAADLLGEGLEEEDAALTGRDWSPTLTLYARWDSRDWPEADGVFVQDSAVLEFIADDGRRRGDGAPVLVAHSTPAFAAAHLDRPRAGLAPLLAELHAVLGFTGEPRWAAVQRWSLARPLAPHEEPFHLGSGCIGVCGDGWGGRPRVEAAYLSGRALGAALAERLG